jgi:Carbohydrate binding module (family 6)/Glycosyl hydrolases family 16
MQLAVPSSPRATPPSGHRRRTGRTAILASVGAALALTASFLVIGRSAHASTAPAPSGWTQVWADDFNGPAGTLPSATNWRFDQGPGSGYGTGEVETTTDSTRNVSLDGKGDLAITPVRDSSGHWTSGRIESQRDDFQPPPGGTLLVQSRIQLPAVTGAAAAGYWPAFWMLGSPMRSGGSWPGSGEFDVLEDVNGQNLAYGTLHCGVGSGGPCKETTGLGGKTACPTTACAGNWHTYSFEWDRSTSPQQLRWYVDGKQYWSVNSSQVDATTWANATNHSAFIILDLAMGGGFPNAVAHTTTPNTGTTSGAPMLVDYVAVYSTTPGAGHTAPPTPAPPTKSAPPTPVKGSTSAYGTIQAESFTSQSGTKDETTTDTGGGQDVGWISNGDWLGYGKVDFGTTGATQFQARVASGAPADASGLVQVRLDSPTAPPVGSFSLANTGGWQNWRTVPATIARTTGTHTVYLTFASGQPADYVNVNWFTFKAN